MKRSEIIELLNARIICDAGQADVEILCACGSDMMSDVLAFTKNDAILLTGLVNNHVLRTSEILDIQNIMFVRGKVPADDVIEMAKESGISLMTTKLPMFTACGILYANGIQGGMRDE